MIQKRRSELKGWCCRCFVEMGAVDWVSAMSLVALN